MSVAKRLANYLSVTNTDYKLHTHETSESAAGPKTAW